MDNPDLTTSQIIAEAFTDMGGKMIDPPTLLPAALPLDMSGEAMRARLCTFFDAKGHELCLRPDLTLPIALDFLETHVISNDTKVSNLRYQGRAFRLPYLAEDSIEFTQIGFESFGGISDHEADARALYLVSTAVEKTDVNNIRIRFGDKTIFDSFLELIDLPPAWHKALKSSQGRSADIERMLTNSNPVSGSALAIALSYMDAHKRSDALCEIMAMGDISHQGTRSMEEVAERLIAQAQFMQADALPQSMANLIRKISNLSGSPTDIKKSLEGIEKVYKIDLSPVHNALDMRIISIEKLQPAYWSNAEFSMNFGHKFDYYDSFAFELYHDALGADHPIAAGGRYDGLLAKLSDGKINLPAIGGMVRPERLDTLREIKYV